MDVYLVQHGEALAEAQDPQRPLSEAGRAATAKVADHLAARGRCLVDPPITSIWHSGKLRAHQTAEIFARGLGSDVPLTVRPDLAPNQDPRAVADELTAMRDRPESVLLVGHLPHLARLAGLLLASDGAKSPVRFANSGVLKLAPAGTDWTVQWYVTPACV
ncbi:MAG TPA: phosphohistidine phosphatase SixA [Phycisphaerae bacterium]|nr:phosphohistidine phosphatase SixA [Phycisphaerae bacterium]